MDLIINVPDEDYEYLKSHNKNGLYNAILNGIPLPKGHERKFEEIVVEYPPAELCTYPEYRGKPYFSIKYEEDGEHFIGFGTYNPEVFSWYLRHFFYGTNNHRSGQEE